MEAIFGKEYVTKLQTKEESSRVVILRQFYQALKQRQNEVKVSIVRVWRVSPYAGPVLHDPI